MIRANLLPRPKETISLFGLELDREYLRQALVGLAIVIGVALIGIAIEQLHIRNLQAQALDQESAIAANALRRAEAKALANDVAHYQEFARQAQLFRRTGADAAIEVARVGNRVPSGVWLDGLAHTGTGYDLTGGARSIDAVSGAILALGSALPGNAASLVNVANKPDDGIAFSARVGTPSASPGPSPAASAAGGSR